MKIQMYALGCVSDDIAERNIAYAKSLGWPELGPSDSRGNHLAVVGGGPSVQNHIESLRYWNGDVWAINGAWQWCEDNGIEAALFSVDPSENLADVIGEAKRVYLASVCDPGAFRAARYVRRVFEIGPGKLLTGSTSATAAAAIAPHLDFRRVTFFGCEGSYSFGATHAYAGGIKSQNAMRVRCGDTAFDTDAGFLMQAEFLAAVIRAAPTVYDELSGGLLTALVADPDYDVTAVSRAMLATLKYEAA
jgi:hypothetical protein